MSELVAAIVTAAIYVVSFLLTSLFGHGRLTRTDASSKQCSQIFMPLAPSSHPIVAQYTVTSNDVISDELRINVCEEHTGRIVYYKDRRLAGKEILQGIYHNSPKGPTLRWVIHRPTRGWYIHIRAPFFPPESFVALVPSTPERGAADGALEFGSRTNVWPSIVPEIEKQRVAKASDAPNHHSYPPSKPATPTADGPIKGTHSLPTLVQQHQITKFILQPTPHASGSSLLSKTISTFHHNLSFTLSPILPSDHEGTAANAAHPSGQSSSDLLQNQLLSFVEAPHSSFATSSGSMTINEGLAAQLGIEITFWIAVALAYWEFLGERESYMLSANG